MLDYSELKKGTRIILNNQPHEIIEASPIFKGRGHSTLQVRLKNLIDGNLVSQTFHPSDSFEEAELKRINAKFPGKMLNLLVKALTITQSPL